MKYEYDVALSYKSEVQDKVKRIADYLIVDKWRVFFAPYNQHEMLSRDIHTTLYDVFKNKSMFKFLFISDTYVDSEWTALEMRISLNSVKERERVLIINLAQNIQLPLKYRNLLYLEGKDKTEDEIALFLTEHMKNYGIENEKIKEKCDDEKWGSKKEEGVTITINKGIIAGNKATFGNITL